MYKKIYLEITNNCNLSCSFCSKNNRKKRYMNKEEFTYIIDKLKKHTKYLYFHVLGEPTLHPNICEFIDIASKYYKVNITTNGYLIDKIKNCNNIRQINISLQSFNSKYGKTLEEYMNSIFNAVDVLSNNTYISYRFWINSKYNKELLEKINKKYNTNLKIDELKNNTTISKNVFISINNEFIWPDLNNNYYNEFGKCYALIDHIAILVDGTIVPCCLDSKGIIKLGNIFEDNIDDLIKSDKYQNMLNGFKNNKKEELLCRKCNFLDKK